MYSKTYIFIKWILKFYFLKYQVANALIASRIMRFFEKNLQDFEIQLEVSAKLAFHS